MRTFSPNRTFQLQAVISLGATAFYPICPIVAILALFLICRIPAVWDILTETDKSHEPA